MKLRCTDSGAERSPNDYIKTLLFIAMESDYKASLATCTEMLVLVTDWWK